MFSYCLFYQNALRAVVEHHQHHTSGLPPLKVLICQGNKDITIKVKELNWLFYALHSCNLVSYDIWQLSWKKSGCFYKNIKKQTVVSDFLFISAAE